MTAPAPPADFDTASATPGYVLAVLRDHYRYGDYVAAGEEALSADTTVREWRATANLVEWRALGRAMNLWWDIDRPDAEWETALRPEKTRTVGDLCNFIAAHAVRPVVRPANVCGVTCAKAGAFRAVRALLIDAGMPGDEPVAPSTPLAESLRRFPDAFRCRLSRLAPGGLPMLDASFETGVGGCAMLGVTAGPVCLVAAMFSGSAPLLVAACAGVLCCYLVARHEGADDRTLVYRFGDLRTFRDLAEAIAAAEGRI